MKNNNCLLKPINFTVQGRCYNLEFQCYPLIQIEGESSIGKSLFANDFRVYLGNKNKLDNALFIDAYSSGIIKLLLASNGNVKYDYIVIDNADILMTEELDNFICDMMFKYPDTYWVIIGRKRYQCSIESFSVGTLKHEMKSNGIEYITLRRESDR